MTAYVAYQLVPEPTHVNAPDAWAVWRDSKGFDEDGDPVVSSVMIAHGIPLSDALEQIKLDQSIDLLLAEKQPKK